jgi:hypothetical protein
MKGLADSQAIVDRWEAETGRLVLRIEKEIGPEVGFLTFSGVLHVNLPARFTLGGLEAGGHELLREEDSTAAGLVASHDATERVFVLHESWGGNYWIVAELMEYRIDERSQAHRY